MMIEYLVLWLLSAFTAFIAGVVIICERKAGVLIRIFFGAALIIPPSIMLITLIGNTRAYAFIYAVNVGLASIGVGSGVMVVRKQFKLFSLHTGLILVGSASLACLSWLNFLFSNME